MTKTLSLSRGWGSPWDGFSACLKCAKYQYMYVCIYLYQPKAYVNCWCMYLSAMHNESFQSLIPHRNMSRMAVSLAWLMSTTFKPGHPQQPVMPQALHTFHAKGWIFQTFKLQTAPPRPLASRRLGLVRGMITLEKTKWNVGCKCIHRRANKI